MEFLPGIISFLSLLMGGGLHYLFRRHQFGCLSMFLGGNFSTSARHDDVFLRGWPSVFLPQKCFFPLSLSLFRLFLPSSFFLVRLVTSKGQKVCHWPGDPVTSLADSPTEPPSHLSLSSIFSLSLDLASLSLSLFFFALAPIKQQKKDTSFVSLKIKF